MYASFAAAQFATGWKHEPEKTAQKHEEWAKARPIEFAVLGAAILAAEDNAPVLLFQGEQKVRGKVTGAWNQKQVGSCVGFGHARGGTDLMLWEIACGVGDPERDPGADGSPEVIYGGSRVEIGGGQLGNSDGSLGAWAADWLIKFGFVVRGKYGNLDLTTYSESVCRQLGRNGIPADLEGIAKQHPVTSAAVVRNKEEAWSALGAGKPVVPCSNVGFDSPLDSKGFCRPNGSWGHCMDFRGRFVHPDNGRTILCANSWDDYLGDGGKTKVYYVTADGKTDFFYLPTGHFCIAVDKTDAIDRMTQDGDTHALAGLTGWKVERLDYTP